MITLAAGINTMTSNTLSSAGLALGLGLLAVEHIRWWRGGGGAATAVVAGGKKGAPAAPASKSKDPMVLMPTWLGIAFGVLMVSCPAGMLGAGAGVLRWGGNGVGGTIMRTLTGANAATVATAGAPRLDDKGAIIVTALVIVLWMLRKTYAKAIRGKFLRGVWIGTLLAIGTGIFAAVGQVVVPGVNSLGAQVLGSIVNGVNGSFV